MRILITNDDGINAPGLKTLARIADEIAGPDGEVWTVAPAFEQSGVAHCISYTHPMLIAKMDDRRFAAEGSPADCVMAGLHDVMTDTRPDLVLSGVNRGNNSAENALYSGTLGGAIEAALQGLPAVALSQYLGSENFDAEDPFEAAAVHGADTIRKILGADPSDQSEYRLFYASPPKVSVKAPSSAPRRISLPAANGSSGCGAAINGCEQRPGQMPWPTWTGISQSRQCARISRRMM